MKKYSCIWGIDPAIMGIETKTVSREHKFEKILNSGLENYSAKNILKRLNGIDFENILSWVILKTWNENFFENSQSFMAADWLSWKLKWAFLIKICTLSVVGVFIVVNFSHFIFSRTTGQILDEGPRPP